MSKNPVAASLTSIPLDAVDEGQATSRPEVESPPSGVGTKALTLRISPTLHRELKTQAFNEETTSQNLILNALLEYGFKSAVPDRRIPSNRRR
jgi:hypothetical protein